jgi:hypothetical protein
MTQRELRKKLVAHVAPFVAATSAVAAFGAAIRRLFY